MKDRIKYTWISAANKEYDNAVAQVLFLSTVHSKIMHIKQLTKELWPKSEVDYWCNLVLDQSEDGLIQRHILHSGKCYH